MAGTLATRFSEIDKADGWMLLFTALRQQSAQSFPSYNAARTTANARLNRYRDILPFDHSRVRIGQDGYINASHVPLPEAERSYILTQGPLVHTAGDFWEMVWEQKSCAIVMLNRIMEKGQNKCHLYYPTLEENNGYSSKVHKYGNFEVELLNETKSKHYVVRILELSSVDTGEKREVTHFQFVTWPDFGVPESTSDFLEFLLEVRRSGLLNYKKYGPPIVHCSAGVGRSGTFVIADAALVIAHKTKDTSKIDIVQMVLDLRYFRMGLIQTHEQLRFSWKAVVDALEEERWKELVETACCDDQQSDPQLDPKSTGESSKSKRPSLKRLSGNQLTDDSSDIESENAEGEGNSGSTSATSQSRESEKSPKRPRPDISRFTDTSTGQWSVAEEEEKYEEEGNKKTGEVEPGKNDGDSTAVERYEARLRRRQQRALEIQKKVDKIHENLRRSNNVGWWNIVGGYPTMAYGIGALAVGGFLVYLYCRWGF